MKLWVDDVRPAPDGWIWAKSYKSAMKLLEQNDWDFDVISLDHDLGGTKTGYDILYRIERRAHEYVNYAPFIGVHTANPVARDRMIPVANNINTKRLKGRKHR